jgi:two-component system chemotaxis response regulator CheB
VERALASSRDRHQDVRSNRRIRLMIVDDSVVARAVLSRIVESDSAFEIAAVASTAEDALDALNHVRVDIILLDLEMPGAGGLKSIPQIIRAANGAKVMIVSSLAEEGAEATVAALALGAADTLPKPGIGRFNGRFSEILLGKLKSLGQATISRPSPGSGADAKPVAALRAMPCDPIEVLAIGSSTGGIHALNALFQSLPARIGVPILVTQHLPHPFMPVFARQLGVVAKREAVVGEDGVELLPDRIIVAPGDGHLTLDWSGRRLVVKLTRGRSASGCMPSVDPMFSAVATAFGSGALGVVLTGMGRDGVDGAHRLIGCGGSILAQDEASSAVWGMPRAVLEAGLASAVLSPDKIARRIASRTEERLTCK